jgi:hypothetical protein
MLSFSLPRGRILSLMAAYTFATRTLPVYSSVYLCTLFITTTTGGGRHSWSPEVLAKSTATSERSSKSEPLTTHEVKKMTASLKRAHRSLKSVLGQVKRELELTSDLSNADQGLRARRQRKRAASHLKKVLKTTSLISGHIQKYHQRQRHHKLKSSIYLKLRAQVWAFIDERESLFNRIDGRLCLRPIWSRAIAQLAERVERKDLSLEYWMRAYRCGGESQDLIEAQRLSTSSTRSIKVIEDSEIQ